ncbi:MAG TPA: hypothetical protein VFU21_06515 [Kofleriaceae bacterium]|nr:hypothetical protein [Kofleriaceae bacterium]
MSDRPSALELAALITGAVVALFGLASILSFADHLMGLSDRERLSEPMASSVAYVGAEGMLVVAEAVAVVLFTAMSAAVIALRRHGAALALAAGAAVGKVVWLAASVGGNWKPGWYFILDPKGAHTVTLYLFAGSIAQAVLMAGAALAVARRGRAAA